MAIKTCMIQLPCKNNRTLQRLVRIKLRSCEQGTARLRRLII